MFLRSSPYDPQEKDLPMSGFYLLLMQPDFKDVARVDWTTNAPLRAFVAKVQMEEMGRLRIGEINVGGHVVTVTGNYGNDGLPKVVAPDVYEAAGTLEVPADLKELWGNGLIAGAGTEVPALYEWARRAFPKARHLPALTSVAGKPALRPLPPTPVQSVKPREPAR